MLVYCRRRILPAICTPPVLCTILVLCAFVAQETRARPLNQERRDVNPFSNGIPTTNNGSRLQPCYKQITETFGNGSQSRVVSVCCDGYTGDNCDVKEPATSSGDDKIEFDPVDPCKNLECRGVEGAQCLPINKCGERWPVFLLSDGTLAQCTNGQPVDVSRLTCTERCAVDPCAGQTCPMHPNAFCVHTACNCQEPLWVLDNGVQVDCETGELLSPEEAKNRRRRKRQAVNTPPPSEKRQKSCH